MRRTQNEGKTAGGVAQGGGLHWGPTGWIHDETMHLTVEDDLRLPFATAAAERASMRADEAEDSVLSADSRLIEAEEAAAASQSARATAELELQVAEKRLSLMESSLVDAQESLDELSLLSLLFFLSL